MATIDVDLDIDLWEDGSGSQADDVKDEPVGNGQGFGQDASARPASDTRELTRPGVAAQHFSEVIEHFLGTRPSTNVGPTERLRQNLQALANATGIRQDCDVIKVMCGDPAEVRHCLTTVDGAMRVGKVETKRPAPLHAEQPQSRQPPVHPAHVQPTDSRRASTDDGLVHRKQENARAHAHPASRAPHRAPSAGARQSRGQQRQPTPRRPSTASSTRQPQTRAGGSQQSTPRQHGGVRYGQDVRTMSQQLKDLRTAVERLKSSHVDASHRFADREKAQLGAGKRREEKRLFHNMLRVVDSEFRTRRHELSRSVADEFEDELVRSRLRRRWWEDQEIERAYRAALCRMREERRDFAKMFKSEAKQMQQELQDEEESRRRYYADQVQLFREEQDRLSRDMELQRMREHERVRQLRRDVRDARKDALEAAKDQLRHQDEVYRLSLKPEPFRADAAANLRYMAKPETSRETSCFCKT